MVVPPQEMPQDVQLFNLFSKFRSDAITKLIIQRAKSILAADESFFSATSPNQRKEGPELPERLGRVFIESMLEKRPGSILTVTQAYTMFCNLSQQRNLNPINRADFKEMMKDMMNCDEMDDMSSMDDKWWVYNRNKVNFLKKFASTSPVL